MNARLPRALALLLLAGLPMACRSVPTGQQSATAREPATHADEADPPATASAFVLQLRALAREGRDAELAAHVDAAFAQRLPSGDDLGDALRAVPAACEITLNEGPGYATVAIPPPMVDDTDEDAARIEALIDELRASTEVEGSCDCAGAEGPNVLFTIAVRRNPEGWRALAWRDHQAETGGIGFECDEPGRTQAGEHLRDYERSETMTCAVSTAGDLRCWPRLWRLGWNNSPTAPIARMNVSC